MTPSATSTSPSNSDFLSAQQVRLEQEREQILSGMQSADRDLAELRERMEVAEVDFSEEGGEGASTTSERAHIEALKAQLTARLAALEAAIARMDSGRYGMCESCGNPIGEPRLEALPDATLCVTCKSAPWMSRR